MSKQRFSLRKYKFALHGVRICSVFGVGMGADEAEQSGTAVVASAEANPDRQVSSCVSVTQSASEQTKAQ